MRDVNAYLDRIGFRGAVAPNVETLRALHHAHLLAIPYENFDVQFGTPLGVAPEDAFDKIVTRRRGGWCYEMNGLFGWALNEIGFDVTRIASGVGRGGAPGIPGNHLVVKAMLDGEAWIADVGLADGPRDPYPVRVHEFMAAGFAARVEDLGEGGWRLHNHPYGAAPYYDFNLTRADETVLAASCLAIQTNPDSPKKLNALAIRHIPDGYLQLRGRVLREIGIEGVRNERLLESADDLVAVLRERFNLDLPQAASLWPRILARHETLFGAGA